MRRCLIQLADHTHDLRQLVHQFTAVLQPASRVDDQNIRAFRARCLQRLIGQRRRIAALIAGNHLGAGALAPDFQLVNGGRAEGVTGRQHHAFALLAPLLCQLAGGGGLARPVDADKKHHMRAVAGFDHKRGRHRLKDLGDAVGQGFGKRRGGHLAVKFVPAHLVRQPGCHRSAKIRQDQRVLDLFQRRGVD